MIRLLQGESATVLKTLPSESVHACITSPPYFCLRSYLPKDHPLKPLEIGLETTMEEHIERLVAVFREVKRVLTNEACLWLNYGDSYWGGKGKSGYELPHEAEARRARGETMQHGYNVPGYLEMRPTDGKHPFLQPKSLLLMPFRLAMALQSDGWILRSVCPWLKRSALPESVKDRPSSALEYWFLFSKQAKYYYDAEAVRQRQQTAERSLFYDIDAPKEIAPTWGINGSQSLRGRNPRRLLNPAGRNRRNTDSFFESLKLILAGSGFLLNEEDDPLALCFVSEGLKEAHFAAFPPKLIVPLVKSSTSEKGCCPVCLKQWRRVVERSVNNEGYPNGPGGNKRYSTTVLERGDKSTLSTVARYETQTLGWQPSCDHAEPPIPCTILDCFSGAGTTLMVADRLGRNAIGIDLNPTYHDMSKRRLEQDAGLFADIEEER